MPRAENRKRPPNLSGKSGQGGYQSKKSELHLSTGPSAAQNKKQELLEKMKKQQQQMQEKQQ